MSAIPVKKPSPEPVRRRVWVQNDSPPLPPEECEGATVVTADLATLDLLTRHAKRFRFIDAVDSLGVVESEALTVVESEPVDIVKEIMRQPLKGKAKVFAQARKVWRLKDEEIDALHAALIVTYLRVGSTRDIEALEAKGRKPKITPPASRVRTAAIASLRAIKDELRSERQHRFGNPLTRTENGVEVPAKRPMRRAYTEELNPDNRQAPQE